MLYTAPSPTPPAKCEAACVHAALRNVMIGGFYFPSNVTAFPFFWAHYKVPWVPLWSSAMFEAWFVDTENRAYVNQECVQAEGSHAKCWSVSTMYKYISTPLFVAENKFDQEQLNEVLLCPSCSARSRLPSPEAAFIASYGENMRRQLIQFSSHRPTVNAVFMPSCFGHTDDLNMGNSSSIPRVRGVTYGEALAAWVSGADSTHLQLLDDCVGSLPCNPSCSV